MLNPIDEIIIKEKQMGTSDKNVAKLLSETGHVNYKEKTINSRYRRLCLAIANAKDEELDKGTITWNEEEVPPY